MSADGIPWASSSPARRLREPLDTTVATRSPAPASPAKVSGREPWTRASASTSANTLPAAAPEMFGPAPAAAAAASAAAFLAQPASSTPVTSVVTVTSRRAWPSASVSWRAKPRSAEASTIEAPRDSISEAWAGPPRTATARAWQRSAAKVAGSVPSGGTRPLETTTTPIRLEI